jgi:hypothetical protein
MQLPVDFIDHAMRNVQVASKYQNGEPWMENKTLMM